MREAWSELDAEGECESLRNRPLESLDDIPREIAHRRIEAEFGEYVDPEKLQELRETPDQIENPEEFSDSARRAGIESTEGVLGWSTELEDPAHVRKDELGREIATLIHEDLHRLTDSETLKEVRSDPEIRNFYEGVTEHFTQEAASDLHEFVKGECYPEQVESAREFIEEVGEGAMRDWFFENEVTEELQNALDRMRNGDLA